MKPSPNSLAILASAGSRKTTQLVELALELAPKRVLLTTYTRENLDQIRTYLTDRHGCVPPHVTLRSWYTFLLQDGVRPYQRSVSSGRRAQSIKFGILDEGFRKKIGKANVDAYYFTKRRSIYQDRAADFVHAVNTASGGRVVKRLERLYEAILIDEVQDMSGWDLDILDRLLESTIRVVVVGDHRQATYSTNHSQRNSQFKGAGIAKWFRDPKRSERIAVEERTECFRCNQEICTFADRLFPDEKPAVSQRKDTTGHDGIVSITRSEVPGYVEKYNPMVLRWNRTSNTMGLPAMNIGAAKGKTFARVLIFPTKPMLKYLKTKKPSDAGSLEKLYVAVTRAEHSVAFVKD